MPPPPPAPLDPAIVPSGPREAVDGHQLLARAVGFGRALRKAGLSVDLSAEIDFARALDIVDIGDRELVKAAGAAVFTRRRDDRPVYDRVFDHYWRRRLLQPNLEAPGTEQRPEAEPSDQAAPQEGAMPGDERSELPEDRSGMPIPTDGDADEDEASPDVVTISPDAYSRSETIRHRDFDRMTSQELRDAERLVDLLTPRLELRRTRRYELHRHGRRIAARQMFRRNLASGGEIVNWVWRRPVKRPRPLVVLCDISGSMERHSRLLLRFIQALSASSAVRTESFVFGTRLTRVTRLLKDRNRDRALAKVADAVTDWAGGTRIGESFREFNHKWARRTLRSSGVVIVVSDGWDRGDPRLVEVETARLRRNCHRLVWLNPLAGTPGYQPLAAGMRAANPYNDDFLAAGTVASLERLGEILAGGRAADTRRGLEAAAHVAPALDAVRTFAPPPKVVRQPLDPFAAQPLPPRAT
jgi:uncharacterized protein with von Willebrand factor type A (vWA) domain